jgi:branched-chain amino acid transport system substrate-binding protein
MPLLSRLIAATALSAMFVGTASAAEPVKIGLILPMSGPFTAIGREVEAGVRTWLAQKGDTVAGRKVEVILKDDTGVAPDKTKQLAQDLILSDRVDIIAGFGLTPGAFATAPIATQAKKPMIVMSAATSAITTRSPYILRTSFTLPQVVTPVADWAARNGIRRVYSLVTDYGPGLDAEAAFAKGFTSAGGEVVDKVRTPLQNPDYAPFLQKARDLKPDAIFAFVPSGETAAFLKQVSDRGLTEAGIRLIGPGDITDDESINGMGDWVLGTITAHHYSAAHDSPENTAFREAFAKAAPGLRPNFMAVGGYDGMQLIWRTLEKTGGVTDGDTFIEAAKGQNWTSPRGPVRIETDTRDITQTVYIRKVEKRDGALWNIEFDRIEAVKDPGKQ